MLLGSVLGESKGYWVRDTRNGYILELKHLFQTPPEEAHVSVLPSNKYGRTFVGESGDCFNLNALPCCIFSFLLFCTSLKSALSLPADGKPLWVYAPVRSLNQLVFVLAEVLSSLLQTADKATKHACLLTPESDGVPSFTQFVGNTGSPCDFWPRGICAAVAQTNICHPNPVLQLLMCYLLLGYASVNPQGFQLGLL